MLLVQSIKASSMCVWGFKVKMGLALNLCGTRGILGLSPGPCLCYSFLLPRHSWVRWPSLWETPVCTQRLACFHCFLLWLQPMCRFLRFFLFSFSPFPLHPLLSFPYPCPFPIKLTSSLQGSLEQSLVGISGHASRSWKCGDRRNPFVLKCHCDDAFALGPCLLPLVQCGRAVVN